MATTLTDLPTISPALAPPPGRSRPWLRPVLLGGLIVAIAVASYFLFRTDAGRQLIDLRQLEATGQDARRWVAHHPFAAPFIFLTFYIACAMLVLPVWWLQILSGYAWGLGVPASGFELPQVNELPAGFRAEEEVAGGGNGADKAPEQHRPQPRPGRA